MKKRKIIMPLFVMCILLSVYITAEAEQTDGSQNIMETLEGDIRDISVSTGDIDLKDDTLYSSDYYDALIVQELNEREYAIYSNQLNAQLSDFRIEYLKKMEIEFEEKYKIEKAKFDLGYTTAITVAECQNQYTAVELQIQTALAQQELYKEAIALNGGQYEEILLTDELEGLKEDYFMAFKENSVQLISYNQQLLTTDNEQLAKLVQLQKEQYEIDLQIYVKSIQIQYDNLLRQITMQDKEIVLMESKIDNAIALYDKGKIAEIQLKELETELSRQKYERMSSICDAKQIHYILTHTIEGQDIL